MDQWIDFLREGGSLAVLAFALWLGVALIRDLHKRNGPPK